MAPIYLTTLCRELFNKCSAVAEMGDCLATTHIGQKLEGALPLSGVELDPHLTQCGLAEAYVRIKWHLNPSSCLATIDVEDSAQVHCACNTVQLSEKCDFRVSPFCQVVQKHKLFEVA